MRDSWKRSGLRAKLMLRLVGKTVVQSARVVLTHAETAQHMNADAGEVELP